MQKDKPLSKHPKGTVWDWHQRYFNVGDTVDARLWHGKELDKRTTMKAKITGFYVNHYGRVSYHIQIIKNRKHYTHTLLEDLIPEGHTATAGSLGRELTQARNRQRNRMVAKR